MGRFFQALSMFLILRQIGEGDKGGVLNKLKYSRNKDRRGSVKNNCSKIR